MLVGTLFTLFNFAVCIIYSQPILDQTTHTCPPNSCIVIVPSHVVLVLIMSIIICYGIYCGLIPEFSYCFTLTMIENLLSNYFKKYYLFDKFDTERWRGQKKGLSYLK